MEPHRHSSIDSGEASAHEQQASRHNGYMAIAAKALQDVLPDCSLAKLIAVVDSWRGGVFVTQISIDADQPGLEFAGDDDGALDGRSWEVYLDQMGKDAFFVDAFDERSAAWDRKLPLR